MNSEPSAVAWSVVVPTFNRPEELGACVTAIAALQPPAGGFEIVIVNDGGIEPPAAVRALAEAGNASSARFLTQNNTGPGRARNHGARHAVGDWLAFTDDDCAPDPDWLLALDRAAAVEPDALLGGRVINALRSNLFSETSQQLVEYVTGYFDGSGRRERFFTSNNIALAKAGFLETGGFDAAFGGPTGEDREFCDRWHAQGRPSRYEPAAVIRHSHVLTMASFLRQHLEYGRGAHDFRAIRRQSDRPTRIDPAFYIGSLRHGLRNRPPWRGAALALLTGAAHGAYAVGLADAALRASGRRGPRGRPTDHSAT